MINSVKVNKDFSYKKNERVKNQEMYMENHGETKPTLGS